MNLKDIESELTEINQFIQSPYTSEPNDLLDRLQKVGAYLSRSGELKANVTYLTKIQIGEKAEAIIKELPKVSPNIFKELLQKYIANESRVLVLADRTNSACSHHSEALRSALSYIKQELYNNQP